MRVFAVRMGDFVEFRSASRPPRGKVSSLTWTTTKKELRFTIYGYAWMAVPVELTLKTVFYTGGRVLGTVRYSVYSRCKPAPKFGRKTLVEVSTRVKDLLLRPAQQSR